MVKSWGSYQEASAALPILGLTRETYDKTILLTVVRVLKKEEDSLESACNSGIHVPGNLPTAKASG